MTPPILAVHGIWNLTPGEPAQICLDKGEAWSKDLAAGYRDARLPDDPPPVVAAYYADLLADYAQGAGDDLEALSPAEQEAVWAWMVTLGVPQEAAQGPGSKPLRQGLDWLAKRRGVAPRALARVMCALIPEVYAYLSRPAARRAARDRVVEALRTHRPRVVVAHSLGSVVTYEALHLVPGQPVELLLTVGSPLGMPSAIFDALEPAPVRGRGVRPPSVRRWANLADPGDLVAVPRRLGDRFDVDLHDEIYIHALDFHLFGSYLRSGATALAIAPYTD